MSQKKQYTEYDFVKVADKDPEGRGRVMANGAIAGYIQMPDIQMPDMQMRDGRIVPGAIVPGAIVWRIIRGANKEYMQDIRPKKKRKY